MSDVTPYFVRAVLWDSYHKALSSIRYEVFVQEQSVPIALELDEWDALAVHVLASTQDETALGCGRLLPDGQIGRMAVRASWRSQGIGRLLLQQLIEEARIRGFREVRLGAQLHALGFYERAGFVAYGDVYDEVNIPHRKMRMDLSERIPEKESHI